MDRSFWIVSELIEENHDENYTPIFHCELKDWTIVDINNFIMKCKQNITNFEAIFENKAQGKEALSAWYESKNLVLDSNRKDVEAHLEAWKKWNELLDTKFGNNTIDEMFKVFTFWMLELNAISKQEICHDTLALLCVSYGIFCPETMCIYFQNPADMASLVKQQLIQLVDEFAYSSLSLLLIPCFMAIGFEKSVFISSTPPQNVTKLITINPELL